MSCVIFGAGKIARGFIGHLLYLSEIPFTFIEKSTELVDLINQNKQYYVNILGAPDKCCTVKGASAYCFDDEEDIAKVISEADAVFTAVGGKNLESIVPMLALGVKAKAKVGGTLNIVTCENWKQPANILRSGIDELLSGSDKEFFDKNVGVSEAVIMRSAIEADKEALEKDPLVVNVQNFWKLPVDASRIVGKLPDIKGLELIESFTGFLERKFYTYNAANGSVSYIGALLGYEKIADAAHDERILKILDGVYHETATALSKKHHFPLDEQLAFTLTSKAKLQDRTIVDFIERNARDPMRKLGPDDRLVGSARLVLEYGIKPENLCIAIAAAIYYHNDSDEFAVQLCNIRKNDGVDGVLSKVCKIDPNGELGLMVKDKIKLLKEWGWINE